MKQRKRKHKHLKQKKLVMKLLKASFNHDDVKIAKLRKKEFKKIFKRKAQGKSFSPEWTVVNV